MLFRCRWLQPSLINEVFDKATENDCQPLVKLRCWELSVPSPMMQEQYGVELDCSGLMAASAVVSKNVRKITFMFILTKAPMAILDFLGQSLQRCWPATEEIHLAGYPVEFFCVQFGVAGAS